MTEALPPQGGLNGHSDTELFHRLRAELWRHKRTCVGEVSLGGITYWVGERGYEAAGARRERMARQAAQAREWLERVGWQRGTELLAGGSMGYDEWWAAMGKAAAAFWGLPEDSRLVSSLVRPIYWEQMGRVFRCRTYISLDGGQAPPLRLEALDTSLGPTYPKNYTGYVIANLERAREGW